ncbi:MAG: hypothetical protein EOM52_00550, partial [Clostridia bacterium]|nr:hypothetical protein [Clostridia bacterium]
MKINRLIASFGQLQGKSLAPGPGLNIICAPNEGGKTTWCAFLKAMFYGIDTKERDTKTSLADKNRWQPWSGAPMEGELALTWGGRTRVLRRFAKGGVPFGGFSAVDAVTGEDIAGLSGDTAGETLLGVSRSVYERSAFIGQGAIPFTGERELEKRIASLVSSGEETISYSQAEQRLKQWQRRRKYNKAGLIPHLESELAALDESLERIRLAHHRQETARLKLERLELQKKELEGEQELHRRLARQELDKRCAEAQRALNAAEKEEETLRARWIVVSERVVEDTRFPGMTPEEAWAKAAEDAAQAKRLGKRRYTLYPLGLGLFGGAILAFIIWKDSSLLYPDRSPQSGIIAAVLALASAACFLWNHSREKKRKAERAALLARYDAAAPEGITSAAAAYREACARADEEKRAAKSAVENAAARRESAGKLLEALTGSGGRPVLDSEPLRIPQRTAEETNASLAAVRGEVSRLGSDFAMARGEMNTLGSPAALAARREQLKEELARRKREYNALALALEELAAANTELQTRFSPALNARAGELMEALTGGKYNSITLTREFQAAAGETDGIFP